MNALRKRIESFLLEMDPLKCSGYWLGFCSVITHEVGQRNWENCVRIDRMVAWRRCQARLVVSVRLEYSLAMCRVGELLSSRPRLL